MQDLNPILIVVEIFHLFLWGGCYKGVIYPLSLQIVIFLNKNYFFIQNQI
jgi:hypothetical protein